MLWVSLRSLWGSRLSSLVGEPSLGCGTGHWDGLRKTGNSEPGRDGTSSSSVTLATSAGGQSLALRLQARKESQNCSPTKQGGLRAEMRAFWQLVPENSC